MIKKTTLPSPVAVCLKLSLALLSHLKPVDVVWLVYYSSRFPFLSLIKRADFVSAPNISSPRPSTSHSISLRPETLRESPRISRFSPRISENPRPSTSPSIRFRRPIDHRSPLPALLPSTHQTFNDRRFVRAVSPDDSAVAPSGLSRFFLQEETGWRRGYPARSAGRRRKAFDAQPTSLRPRKVGRRV